LSIPIESDSKFERICGYDRREIDNLIGRVQREGYTLIPTALYWKGNRVKAELALAKGKREHDKRDASRERDWQRDKARLMKGDRTG